MTSGSCAKPAGGFLAFSDPGRFRLYVGLLLIGTGLSLLFSSFLMVLVADSAQSFHIFSPVMPSATGYAAAAVPASSGSSSSVSGRSLLDIKSDAADSSITIARDTPRYDFNGQPVSNQFKPDNWEYQQSIILIAAIGVLIAILSLFFGLFFCCGRKCCGCCGGTKPSKGCCCPKKDEFGGVETRYYTGCEIWWVRIGMILCFAVVVGMAVMGYIGNNDFHTDLSDIFDTAVSILNEVIGKVNALNAKATALVQSLVSINVPNVNMTLVPTDTVASLNKTIGDVAKNVNDVKKLVSGYDDYRVIGIIAVFAFCVFINLFGFLGAVFCCGWPACIMSVFGFLVLFVVWILFGIHFPLSVLLADFCTSVNTYIKDRRSCEALSQSLQDQNQPALDCTLPKYTPTGEYLNPVLQCAGQDSRSGLVNFQWNLLNIITYSCSQSSYSVTSPCPLSIRGLYQLCAPGAAPGLPNCTAPQYTWVGAYRTTTTNASTEVLGTGISGQYLNLNSATTRGQLNWCVNTSTSLVPFNSSSFLNCNTQEVSNYFATLLTSAAGISDLTADVMALTACSYVVDVFDRVSSKLCINGIASFSLITTPFGVIGAMYVFGVFFAILGMKRNIKQDQDADDVTKGGPTNLKPLPMKQMAAS
eukprot:ANDGO_04915.mRNA.1 Transmembrane protein DDB_G0292058